MMSSSSPLPVHIHQLPSDVDASTLENSIAVVVDLLRASTTIVHALAAGATEVVPCLTVEDAWQQAEEHERSDVILGGERGGVLIEGFDLDNSPLKYTTEAVAGKTVFFTTTNGTKALHHCKSAQQILVGSFVNQAALCQHLIESQLPVNIVCAGTNGQISNDDVICAGSIANSLANIGSGQFEIIDDITQQAINLYQSCRSNHASLTDAVSDSTGGKNLVKLGYQADIERATTLDLYDIVTVYDPELNSIRQLA